MREYPNIQEYMEDRLQQAALRDAQHLKRAGVTTPNKTLLQVLSQQAQYEAVVSYMREVNDTLNYNIRLILQDEKRRIRQTKGEGAHFSVKAFSLLAIVFAAIAGLSFSQHNIILGIVFLAGALLAFVTMGVILSW